MDCQGADCHGRVDVEKQTRKKMVEVIVGRPKKDMTNRFKAEADLRNLDLHPDWYKRHAMKVGSDFFFPQSQAFCNGNPG